MFLKNFRLRRFKEDTDYTLFNASESQISDKISRRICQKKSLRLCKENTDYTYESFWEPFW